MIYCNLCKRTRSKSTNPAQTKICRECNKSLQYLPTQTKLVYIDEWQIRAIISYKPEIEG